MGKNMLDWHEATKLAKYGILALPKPMVSPRVAIVCQQGLRSQGISPQAK
jgi:hypothetical protein